MREGQPQKRDDGSTRATGRSVASISPSKREEDGRAERAYADTGFKRGDKLIESSFMEGSIMKKRGWIVVAVMLASILGLSGCFGPGIIYVAGTWSGFITWTSGPATSFTSPITLTLVQEEKKTEITGEIGLMGPGSKPFSISITDGTAGNGEFTIQASGVMDVVTPHANVQIDLEGKRDGDVLSGTGTQTNDGAAYTFSWSATLQASTE